MQMSWLPTQNGEASSNHRSALIEHQSYADGAPFARERTRQPMRSPPPFNRVPWTGSTGALIAKADKFSAELRFANATWTR